MNNSPKIDIAVGKTLLRLRKERDLTVTALAEGAGISQAMISRIENGQVSPSLGTLSALAKFLNVPITALVAQVEDKTDVYHVKAGKGLPSYRLAPDHVHQYMLLGKHGGPGGIFQSARIRMERKSAGALPSYHHEGHVFIYIISGSATYRCGTQQFALNPGDTLSFDALLPHGVAEINDEHVEFISVSTGPR